NALSTSHAALAQHDSVVLLPSFTTASYTDAIERFHCTTLTAVPTMIAMLLKDKDSLRKADLSSVTAIRMGSAPVSAALLSSIRAMFPNARFQNVYGTRESAPVSLGAPSDGAEQPPLSLGCPHPQVRIRLVNGQNSAAQEGVLEIKSPAMMIGYHKLPEIT